MRSDVRFDGYAVVTTRDFAGLFGHEACRHARVLRRLQAKEARVNVALVEATEQLYTAWPDMEQVAVWQERVESLAAEKADLWRQINRLKGRLVEASIRVARMRREITGGENV